MCSPGYKAPARLWSQAGLKAGEADVVQVYENFSGPAVASLIDLGLCPPGPEAGSFMTLANLIAPDGALPVNTAGGNIAEGFVHGIGLVLEAVRQTRGTSTNRTAITGSARATTPLSPSFGP